MNEELCLKRFRDQYQSFTLILDIISRAMKMAKNYISKTPEANSLLLKWLSIHQLITLYFVSTRKYLYLELLFCNALTLILKLFLIYTEFLPRNKLFTISLSMICILFMIQIEYNIFIEILRNHRDL